MLLNAISTAKDAKNAKEPPSKAREKPLRTFALFAVITLLRNQNELTKPADRGIVDLPMASESKEEVSLCSKASFQMASRRRYGAP